MAPSRGPLEEAMKAKLRQMQAARDLDLSQLQDQLAANVAKVQQHEEDLVATQARLQSSILEVAELRTSAFVSEEGLAELRATSEQQSSTLRTRLEQAYAAKAQLETELVEVQRSAETEAKASRVRLEEQKTCRAELAQAQSAANALHSRCSDFQEEALGS
ncbi:unnamed protein product [Durusdinium trenchii]|uniref:Uncharacterized protein n=2 Tax=Durusdinium trenchii TaxID=1381693 RepID=A0ABP0S8Y7_9DINO